MPQIKKLAVVANTKTSCAQYMTQYEIPVFRKRMQQRFGKSVRVQVLGPDALPEAQQWQEFLKVEYEYSRLQKRFGRAALEATYADFDSFKRAFQEAAEVYADTMGDPKELEAAGVTVAKRERKEIEDIKGIGPATADEIEEILGAATYKALSQADPAEVAQGSVSLKEAVRWIAEAKAQFEEPVFEQPDEVNED